MGNGSTTPWTTSCSRAVDHRWGDARGWFDRLIELAVAVTGAPRGVITFVNDVRTTAISSAGFPEGLPLYAPIEHSFCRFVVATGRPLVVEDAHHDPRMTGDPAIEAFAAVSWIGYGIEDSEANTFGTFCLMDAEPREWSQRHVQTLAKAASTEIALRMLQVELSVLRLHANFDSTDVSAAG